MIPNYASALILNNLVKAYNITNNTVDISTSMLEYSMPLVNENLDNKLGYGLSFLDANISSLKNKIFTLGKGVCQSNLFSGPAEIPDSTNNQFGYTTSEILNGLTEIGNCIVLGAAYLTFSQSGFDIEFSLAKSANDPTGDTIIFAKDISISDVENILEYSTDIVFPFPTGNESTSLLLYKFILDVEKYYNEYKKDRVFIIVKDVRKPRGYLGIPQENAFTNIVPRLIQGDRDILGLQAKELESVKLIVQKWIDLSSWDPSFVDYWNTANPGLPSELQNFIENELGISL
jgi:hypothetical protein